MAINQISRYLGASHTIPEVRDIGAADVIDALSKGFADFNANPTHYIFLCIIYPILMILLARLFAGHEVLPYLFPIIAGSTLLGPLAACGMYEMSRRREMGLEVSWLNCFDVIRSKSIFAITTLGVVLGAIFVVWLIIAQVIYLYFFGNAVPESIPIFIAQILTTSPGWALIIVGCGVGLFFSVLVLTISVVSFPLLLDRHVDVATAILTSTRAVRTNPKSMAIWGLIVAIFLFIGAIPLFVGLAVVMPVLGHATWHLYRKTVISPEAPS